MTTGRARFGRSIAAFSMSAGFAGVVAHLVLRKVDLFGQGNFTVHFALAAVGFGAVVWIVLPSQPHNGMVWALAGAALTAAMATAGTVLLALAAPAGVSSLADLLTYSPSELSTVGAVGAILAGGTWVAAIFLPIGVGLLLFPNGRPPSPRWRWLVWLNTASIIGITLGLTLASNPNSTVPIETSGEDFDGVAGAIVEQLFFPMVLGAVLAIVSLIVRYRRSSGAARPQIQWIALGGGAFLVGAVTADPGAILWPLLVGEILLIAAFFIAITKYRLYDVSIVISRGVTYVSLAVVLGVLYGAAVFSYIWVFATPEEHAGDLGIALPVGATVLVAITFEPLRRRLKRWADRLVYGKRAAPHEVLSQLTAELADTSSGTGLDALARLLAEGTAAETAAVWLRVGDRLQAAAAFPGRHGLVGRRRPLQGDVTSTELEMSVPVRHGDDVLGLLEITKSQAHAVTPADADLLADVAAGAGLLLQNMRLNAELEDRAHQLRDSRRRLIAAHDEVRHRLERDLHDGAQQQVVALKVKLGLAHTIAQRESADDIALLLQGLAEDTDGAVNAMRAVARGIYPPLLEAEGLETALRAWVRTAAADVALSVDVEHRYPRPVEETVYFSVIHAIGAAVAAGATTFQVDVAQRADAIDIDIGHDAPYSVDITSLVDRIDAHDGQLTTADQRLQATLPVTAAAERMPV